MHFWISSWRTRLLISIYFIFQVLSTTLQEATKECVTQSKGHISQKKFQLLSITGMSFASSAHWPKHRSQFLILRSQTDTWGKNSRTFFKIKAQTEQSSGHCFLPRGFWKQLLSHSSKNCFCCWLYWGRSLLVSTPGFHRGFQAMG